MTRRLLKWIGIPLAIVIIAAAGCYVYFLATFKLFEPGPLKTVNPAAWSRLELQMTEQQVIALLGEPPQRYPAIEGKDGEGKTQFVRPAFWEYTWTDGLDVFGPSAKAHAVWFDPEGKVIHFRAPELAAN